MCINMLNSLLFLPILGFYFYNDISKITILVSATFYITYNYCYSLSLNNRYFIMLITPKNYSDPEIHKIITYGFSTINASLLAICATLYLFQIIDAYAFKQVFFISMGYYLADSVYTIESAKKLTKLEYFIIFHHTVLVYYQIIVFTQTDIIVEKTLLYYFTKGLIAEYSLVSLNYAWYLVNTKQNNTNKMFVSSVVTLILYFFTRILNFAFILYNVYYDGFILISIAGLPLVLINYFRFYKLCFNANKIYKGNGKTSIKIDKKEK